ncbi:MAG: hypothetical protein R2838_22840 [Caldilineaceae bacterium]
MLAGKTIKESLPRRAWHIKALDENNPTWLTTRSTPTPTRKWSGA